ncbi:flagellar basal-body MS-ring/collar protein FliF [Parvularcula oceani]|uniref:flagellar basal-body MS-ring/collar protein FliF n=1 Tax=Parvularcula oceani TaxID=1247963 RepID=UPI000565D556|nr:flagellar basal-body MS-ring/collar protein FliF [Parvularcula oceani]
MSLLTTLKELPWQKKAMAGGAVLATVLIMVVLARSAARPQMALLYAGLDSVAAGEVVAALDAEGVAYEIEGERISVPATERDRLRMTLAGDGLPRQSSAGYELLDELSGFSTTSDMFSAAYWRAKEGELTRTVLQIPGVRAARVHIGAESRSPFARERTPRTASVTLTAPGGLSRAQVKAIQHMTALAVSGLSPQEVAVIETARGILTETEDEAGLAGLDENARAAALEADLIRLLEARVGPGNARVEVAMRLSREREAWTERAVDPASAVVTRRSRTERSETETGTDAAVTVASDLPDGDAGRQGAETRSQADETREELTYAVTERDVSGERLPGEITALSIAVLLNDAPGAEGEEPAPRTAEEVAALRGLVASASGLDEARGDRLTIEVLPFDAPALEMAEAPRLAPATEARLWQAGQVAFLGIVALLLGLFVVRPILTGAGQDAAGTEALAALDGGELPLADDPLDALRSAAANEPEAAAALLNAWLEEEDAA